MLNVTLLLRKGDHGKQGMPAFKNQGITADSLLNRLDALSNSTFVFDNVEQNGVGQDFVTRSNHGTSVVPTECASTPLSVFPLIHCPPSTMQEIENSYYQTNRSMYKR